jgi:dipeptidyl aminopeptidase/acylaminoacyl peptidase
MKQIRLTSLRETQLSRRMRPTRRQCVWPKLALFEVGILLIAQLSVHSNAQTKSQRPVTLDDLFNLQQVARYSGGPFDFSLDGTQLAFAIQRPLQGSKRFMDGLNYSDRADVYVAMTKDGQPHKITDGAADGSGWFAPNWSPDGKRLGMLSNRGGKVNVWVWERESGSLRQVTDGSVDLYQGGERALKWKSPTRLMVPLLPPGEESRNAVGPTQAAVRTAAKWGKAWRGEEVTASVLTSGVKPDLSARPQGSLVEVDVEAAKSRVLVNGTVRNICVSPDGSAVAYLHQIELFQPDANALLPLNDLFKERAGRFRLEVLSADGTALIKEAAPADDVVPLSLRWSPDGQELAFLAYTAGRDKLPRLGRLKKSSGILSVSKVNNLDARPMQIPLTSFDKPQLEWSKQGWLVYGTRRSASAPNGVEARNDWWLFGNDGGLQAITSEMKTAPVQLWTVPDDTSFVGLADGNLWRIGVGIEPQNLTAGSKKPITSILWPQNALPGGYNDALLRRASTQIIVSTEQENFAVDMASGNLMAISPPVTGATLAAFSPANQAILYYEANASGLHLWLSPAPQAAAKVIYEANAFLRDIALGRDKKISYRSLNGEELGGWLILPPDYEPGKRYPMIVWVYPNYVAGPKPDITEDIHWPQPSINKQIAAARGYVILKPSIPLNPYGKVDDIISKITSGVLPAVDKVIEMGIADAERLFVMGNSYGGFSVYALITQTNRFKAAVGQSGYSNLISGYGQSGGYHYLDYAHEIGVLRQSSFETMLHLGGPPWKEAERYIRNSPIFYVDRVQTPLLILQGDLDAASIEQAEELFMSLYRQGKRAEFVRYWGEGHIISSPPNVRDMWNRIFAWFDEFSKPNKPM